MEGGTRRDSVRVFRTGVDGPVRSIKEFATPHAKPVMGLITGSAAAVRKTPQNSKRFQATTLVCVSLAGAGMGARCSTEGARQNARNAPDPPYINVSTVSAAPPETIKTGKRKTGRSTVPRTRVFAIQSATHVQDRLLQSA
jgi:hypothetical protein